MREERGNPPIADLNCETRRLPRHARAHPTPRSLPTGHSRQAKAYNDG